ncbi:hypothetical protein EYR38_005405 [Pleurotus pulmonarius]|nr:hypothetical protein EYR38_005405 [Pleurotus pulmonarius]
MSESSRQTRLFEEFTTSVEGRGEGIIEGWTRMISDWEGDKTKPNPYEVAKQHSAKSQKDIRLELIEEERKTPSARKITPATFLTTSMDIEDAQRKVRVARDQPDMTPAQAEDLQKRRLTIQRSLTRIRTVQRVYMPILMELEDTEDEVNQRDVEDEPVWLPSSLEPIHRASCSAALLAKEERLREAQCNDALDSIRSLQRGKAQYIIYKNRNIRGQRPSTRARASLDRLDDKIRLKAAQYRDARRALFRLRGAGDWEVALRPLLEEDLWPPAAFDINDPDDVYGPNGQPKSKKKMKEVELRLGEGYKHTSWVWAAGAALSVDEDLERSDISDGAQAYAKRQAAVYVALKDHFTYLWEQPLCKRLRNKCITTITISGQIDGDGNDVEDDEEDGPAASNPHTALEQGPIAPSLVDNLPANDLPGGDSSIAADSSMAPMIPMDLD